MAQVSDYVREFVHSLPLRDMMTFGGFDLVREFDVDAKGFTVWRKYNENLPYVLSVYDGDNRVFYGLGEDTYNLEACSRVQFANHILARGDFRELARLAREGALGAPKTLMEFAVRAEAGVQFQESSGSLSEFYVTNPLFRDEVDTQRTRELARRLASEQVEEAAFNSEPDKMWSSMTARELLEQERTPLLWRVEGLLAAYSNAIIVAAAKVGKTTFLVNLIHSLITGESFLGAFPSHPSQRRVGLLNYELTEQQCQEWLSSRLSGGLDSLEVWNLRGKHNPLGTSAGRKKLATELRQRDIGILIIDPFSGAFRKGGGASQDNDSVKEFLMQLDEMKLEGGVDELIIAVHAGRNTSRTRGASSLDDHPDSLWYLQSDSDSGLRKFHASGRDVDVPETLLEHDPDTRALTVSALSVSEGKVRGVEGMVLDALGSGPLSASDLVSKVGKRESIVNSARKSLVDKGLILEQHPGGGKKLFRLP